MLNCQSDNQLYFCSVYIQHFKTKTKFQNHIYFNIKELPLNLFYFVTSTASMILNIILKN